MIGRAHRKDEDAALCTSRHVVCIDREDQLQIWTDETEMMELIIVTGGTGEGWRPYRSGCFTAPTGAQDLEMEAHSKGEWQCCKKPMLVVSALPLSSSKCCYFQRSAEREASLVMRLSGLLARSPCFVMFRKQAVGLRVTLGVTFSLTVYSACVKAVSSETGRLYKVNAEVILGAYHEDLSWDRVVLY